ncbi:hypothetical protein Agabi119p4_575 [Agaricus bisporus var. burnettii]|uniref:EamA domain-containing protein n=1 Tax=Agaricus bisporus var. burnettii TaxID=192524 RepID=A0A8H7FAR2_AGABI|nr:hypothetical protein Agabi119p4_575 [Agaricus bisporus var. burnettii]
MSSTVHELDVLEARSPITSDRPRPQTPELLQRQHKANDYWVGLALFIVVVLLWTAGGFVTQALYKNGYDKPFMVTYMSTCPFALYLVPRGIRWVREARHGMLGHNARPSTGYQRLSVSEILDETDEDRPIDTALSDTEPLTVRQTANVAFVFCWLWFIANWAVNAAISYTTIASSTIVTSTSGFFTLGIGQIFGVERFTRLKLLAVFISFLGVVLVSLSDSQASTASGQSSSLDSTLRSTDSSLPLFGDVLALISAFFYAVYVVFLKVKIGDESRIDTQLLLGFVGLFNLLTCWPLGVLLHWFHIERFELPTMSAQWYALLAITIIFLLSDYLYVLAMLKTTPLVVTIGISLTIPVAVVGDFIVNASFRGQVIVGAILVLMSFIAIGLDGSKEL